MAKYISKRVQRTSQTGITSDRYQYLGLNQAEPNLGDPKVGPSSIGANPIPVGQVYQPVSVDTKLGERYWTPLVGFGTTVGVISVYENGYLPGDDNRFQKIHGLNFVGTGVTVDVPPVDGPFEGVGIATIRFTNTQLLNQGEVGEVIYNSPSGYVDGALDFYYNPYTQNVGIGSTIPRVKIDVDGDGFVSGVLTSHFYQTGTGAVKRTVESKLKEPYVSIVDFGAVAGSSTTETSTANGNAIQAAVNAAISSGIRAVFVPAGVWWCNKPITINSDITLFGVGSNTVNAGNKSEIRFASNTTAADGLNGTTGIKTAITVSTGSANQIYNFVLRDLAISAQRSSLQGQDITGLRVSEVSDGRIHNCAFTDFDKTITFEGCARMMVVNNHVGLFGRTIKPTHVISFRESTYGDDNCTGNHITDNEIRGNENYPIQKVIEVLSSDGLYLNHNHLVGYDVGLYIKSETAFSSGVGDIHSSNQYYDSGNLHCVLVESEPGDNLIRDLVFNSDYFRGGQENTNPMIKINNDPTHNVIKSITLDGCRIAQSKGGPGIAITNLTPQVRNLNIKNCEFRELNRGSLNSEYNHAHLCAINASITGNIFDAQDTTYLSGSGATNGKLVVVSAGTSQYVFSDNIFYTSSDSHNVVTLPEIEGRQVFGNIHNNQYLENFNGPVPNIKGGVSGNVVYQNNSGITSFVENIGANNKILKYDGVNNKPFWGTISGVDLTDIPISEDNADENRYISFVDVTSGVSSVKANPNLIFNPNTSAVGIGTTPSESGLTLTELLTFNGAPGSLANVGRAVSPNGLSDGGLALTGGRSTTGANIVLWGKDSEYPDLATYDALTHKFRNRNATVEYVTIGSSFSVIHNSIAIGSTTLTGTDNQRLQVTGGAYVSGNVGLGTTLPGYRLDVNGTTRLRGALRDFNDAQGSTSQLLQSIGTGVSWISQSSLRVGNADNAGYASTAGIATYAVNAGVATYADRAGIATYATDAGISTNLKGGAAGSIPYQSSSGITTFLAASGVDGYILEYDTATSKPQWISPSNLTVQNAVYASTAGIATYATRAGIATYADRAGIATYADRAGIATYADRAGIATYATKAGLSTNIEGGATGSIPYQSSSGITTFLAASGVDGYILEYDTATSRPQWVSPSNLSINYANSAGYAAVAGFATVAGYASTAGIATYATRAGVATYADRAGIATYATDAGISTHIKGGSVGALVYQASPNFTTFVTAGTNGQILQYNDLLNKPEWVNASNLTVQNANYALVAGVATYATRAGVATYAVNAGLATNIQNGAAGQVVYQSAVNTTAFIPTTNATGKFLQFNGSIPTWADIPGVSTITVSSDSANATRFMTFVDGTSGVSTIRTSPLFTINPSTGAVGIGTTPRSENNTILTVDGRIRIVDPTTEILGLGRGESPTTGTYNSGLSISGGRGGDTGSVISLRGKDNASNPNEIFYDALVHNFRNNGATPTLTYAGIGSLTSFINSDFGVGTSSPSDKLDVNGTIRLRGALKDVNNNVGAAGSVLISTVSGVRWEAPASIGGGGGGGTGGSIFLREEGVGVGTASVLNFVSQNLTVSVAGTVGVVTLTDSPSFTTVRSGKFESTRSNCSIAIGDFQTGGNETGGCNITIGSATGFNAGSGNVAIGHRNLGGITAYTVSLGFLNAVSSTYTHSFLVGYKGGYYGIGQHNIFLGNYSGFAVGGINCNNIFLGNNTGRCINSALDNVFIGQCAGYNNSTGSDNIFIGEKAGYTNTTQNNNVFIGKCAGYTNASGSNNTFIGELSGFCNSTGCNNVAIGQCAGYSSIAGNNNTFLGEGAGYNHASACDNTFIGQRAGEGTIGVGGITGCFNTFIGRYAGRCITSGNQNVLLGTRAGCSITSGSSNVLIGQATGNSITTGNNNTVIGRGSALSLSTGCRNVILGFDNANAITNSCCNVIIGVGIATAATSSEDNVIIGANAGSCLTTGSDNTIIGFNAGQSVTSGSYNIIIGRGHSIDTGVNNITINPPGGVGAPTGSNLISLSGISSAIVIGNTNISTFYTKMAAKSFAQTTVKWSSSTYELAADTSSRRFKTDIRPYTNGIEDILKLESVIYKPVENPNDADQVGLIAEQVDEIGLTEFVAYDENSQPLSVSYDRMIALAINAIKDLKEEINTLKNRIDTLESK